MRKQLLLAATLGALAITPVPASAHGHAPLHPNVESSFGIRIIVRDGPQVVHHHHDKRHFRPQPWPRRYSHHAPAWRRHGPWRDGPRDFHWRAREHRPWFRAPGAPHFKDGDGKRWSHGPRHHGRPAAGNRFPNARFKDGHRGFDRRRHH